MEQRGEQSAGTPEGTSSAREARMLNAAVVGISVRGTCGVRDHAGLLAEALSREDVKSSLHWLLRTQTSLPGVRSEIGRWLVELLPALERERPDVILLHYSVFSYSYKGVPVFVRPVLSALRASGIPVVSILHEYAYPWGYGGWRGGVWALSQRIAMVEVMRSTSAAVVTAEERLRWLGSRRWLARRPIRFAPVFSNLPAPSPIGASASRPPTVGLFGYAYQGAAQALVLDALALVAERVPAVQLRLLGSPGPASTAAEQWRAAATRRGLAERLFFSGRLPAAELSDALAACEVLLFADESGPSSRKGTLAGSLASGRPVVAIEGPRGWPELVRSGAIVMVDASARALGEAVGALLEDRPASDVLGVRGREFAESRMGVARTAEAVVSCLQEISVTAPGGDPQASRDAA